MITTDTFGKDGRDINSDQLLALLLLFGYWIRVGDDDLVNVRTSLQFLETVVNEQAVGSSDVDLCGATVQAAVLSSGNEGAWSVDHVVQDDHGAALDVTD
ncbi:hypothetical protein WICPIJ_006244 [Wickerhamomyces pijperi]|uniref:Uncharacterized protein n=1 Tax=Wickerhamomyces pijperi TaxID=599730 RepID=A0A9P8Q422_WICPI|nr:hypothetical protein WICPIJ_006244 [Wickerhamomyces pijperi]